MKKLTLMVFLAFAVGHLHAQNNPANKAKGKENDLIVNKPALVKGFQLTKVNLDKSYLLIVDDMIFDSSDERFKRIPLESLELVRTINDSLSTSMVKHILIYKTKAK